MSAALTGRPVRDRDGRRCATVTGLVVSRADGAAEWLRIELDGGGSRLVPAGAASTSGDEAVHLPWTAAEIERSPDVSADPPGPDEITRLQQHYVVGPDG